MSSNDNVYQIMDHWEMVTIDAIWKELVEECVKECIQKDQTGLTDDWELVQPTPFTEPFWGIVVNK